MDKAESDMLERRLRTRAEICSANTLRRSSNVSITLRSPSASSSTYMMKARWCEKWLQIWPLPRWSWEVSNCMVRGDLNIVYICLVTKFPAFMEPAISHCSKPLQVSSHLHNFLF